MTDDKPDDVDQPEPKPKKRKVLGFACGGPGGCQLIDVDEVEPQPPVEPKSESEK